MEVKAVDIHTHPSTKEYIEGSFGTLLRQIRGHFRAPISVRSVDEMADEYRQQGIVACVSAFDAEITMGGPATTNDFIAEMVQRHPDVFIGWASVDPRKGKAAVLELERAIKELGLRGVGELHPICQAFFPNDHSFYPLYEKCVELDVHVTFHTGTTGVGAGLSGGGGYKLKYSQPIYIDDLAADFPELKIVCAHPSIPWLDEEIALVTHKGNVFMDLSGWHPRFFSEQLINQINTTLQDKIMFGTDYPWIIPEKWLTAFDKLPIADEVRPKILKENARRIFNI
jgi:predicted TIM-barrel fold metal-dependent hydrolase